MSVTLDVSVKGVKDGKIERRGRSDEKVQKKITVVTTDDGSIGVLLSAAGGETQTGDGQKENQQVAATGGNTVTTGTVTLSSATKGKVTVTTVDKGTVTVTSPAKGTITLKVTASKTGAVSKAVKQRKAAAKSKVYSGRHPVTELVELCQKRKWAVPEFVLVERKGPDEKPSFLFKVTVNDIEYKGRHYGTTKKTAKMDAARTALTDLNILLVTESLEDMEILPPD